MMGTPRDLEDFAVGFAFTERLIDGMSDIDDLEAIDTPLGIDLRVWLRSDKAAAVAARRLSGPVGCGLCGVESLAAASPRLPMITRDLSIAAPDVLGAVDTLAGSQGLHASTRATHAAALWDCGSRSLLAAREDVGRHNALDKVVGAALRERIPIERAAVVVTSRISIELVHKAARLGAPLLIGFSAPTTAAVDAAAACGMTLVGNARGEGFDVYAHPDRVVPERSRGRAVRTFETAGKILNV